MVQLNNSPSYPPSQSRTLKWLQSFVSLEIFTFQNQFDEQQAKRDGKEKEKAGPLLTMSQWKELLQSNKKASSLSVTNRILLI